MSIFVWDECVSLCPQWHRVNIIMVNSSCCWLYRNVRKTLAKMLSINETPKKQGYNENAMCCSKSEGNGVFFFFEHEWGVLNNLINNDDCTRHNNTLKE